MPPKSSIQKKQWPTMCTRRRATNAPGKPWLTTKCKDFDKGAMTRSLENYIDKVSKDEDIFNLCDSYKRHSNGTHWTLQGSQICIYSSTPSSMSLHGVVSRKRT